MSEALKSWPRRLPALSIPLGLVAAAAVLHGCSLAYDLSTTQCNVDADCESIGEGLVCGPEHLCQIDTSGCATNAECLDAPDNFGLTACIKDPAKDPAKTRGACTPLTTPECPQVLPLDTNLSEQALRTGDPVIFGAFTNVTLSTRLYNYDLAVSEFQMAGGIRTSGGTRPVLMVACNGAATEGSALEFQASLDQAMDHLIELHVPGVVSGLEVPDLKHVFEKGKAAKMFFMSSGESDSSLGAALQDNGLVWEVLPGGTGLARTYKPLVDRTISFLQGKGTLSGPARIALVSAPDISLLADMGNALQSAPADGGITFNDGKSVLDNIRENNFFGTTTPSIIADKTADLSTKVDELLDFKPHIIVSTGASEFLTKILPSLEQRWDSSTGGQARPFYILSPYQYNRPALTTAMTSSSTLRQRVIGLNAPAATDPGIYDSYVARFHINYPSEMDYEGYENYYDSAYYLLYAASAAAPALTDGASMVTGMSRLLQGTPYRVGPADMDTAVGALINGLSISLIGAGGPPNFNVLTGGKDDAASVWCVDSTMKTQADVLRYQDSDGTMQGTFPCFPDY
ncbi:MAG TPA: hypothetical protein VFS67_17050 [Polyangiaceae bacterium]|nr:hypothetical protein [Polyangiaceae bacterium]